MSNFYKLSQELTARKDLKASDKILYAVILNYQAGNDSCWPGMRKLKARTGLCVDTINKSIRRLESKGFLDVQKQANGKCNIYKTVPKNSTVKSTPENTDRTGKQYTTVPKTSTEPYRKTVHKRKDLNKRLNIAETSFSFILKNGKDWILTQAKYDEYKGTYPDVDLDTELKKMIQWLRDNPGKRKTASGMTRFINSWLNRARPDEAKLQQKKLDDYSEKLLENAPTPEEARKLLWSVGL